MHGKVTFFGTLRIGNYNQRLRTATTKAQRRLKRCYIFELVEDR